MSRVFEDFRIGQRLVSVPREVSKAEIVEFAREFDPQPFHLSGTSGEEHLLGGLIASGWHTAALSMRMFVDTMQVPGGIIGLAVDELRWPEPVRPKDLLHVEITILEARLSRSRAGYGVVRYECLTKNQNDTIVQSFFAATLVPATTNLGGEGIEPPANTV